MREGSESEARRDRNSSITVMGDLPNAEKHKNEDLGPLAGESYQEMTPRMNASTFPQPAGGLPRIHKLVLPKGTLA